MDIPLFGRRVNGLAGHDQKLAQSLREMTHLLKWCWFHGTLWSHYKIGGAPHIGRCDDVIIGSLTR
jgi:hypothetical protein